MIWEKLVGVLPISWKNSLIMSKYERFVAPLYFSLSTVDTYSYQTPIGTFELKLPRNVSFTNVAECGDYYEPQLVQAMSQSGLAHGTFYDVGARYGFSSRAAILCGVPEANIHAFEASEINYRILQRNIPDSNLNKTEIGNGDNGTTELDTYIQRTEDIPDAIKVDVEGAEKAVLDGSWSIIAEDRPTLFIELHPRVIGPRIADNIVARIRDVGYEVLSTEHHDGDTQWRRYDEPAEEEFLIWCR